MLHLLPEIQPFFYCNLSVRSASFFPVPFQHHMCHELLVRFSYVISLCLFSSDNIVWVFKTCRSWFPTGVDLAKALNPEAMLPILANAEVQERLIPYLPEGELLPKTEAELRNTVSSPQFQQVGWFICWASALLSTPHPPVCLFLSVSCLY